MINAIFVLYSISGMRLWFYFFLGNLSVEFGPVLFPPVHCIHNGFLDRARCVTKVLTSFYVAENCVGLQCFNTVLGKFGFCPGDFIILLSKKCQETWQV